MCERWTFSQLINLLPRRARRLPVIHLDMVSFDTSISSDPSMVSTRKNNSRPLSSSTSATTLRTMVVIALAAARAAAPRTC